MNIDYIKELENIIESMELINVSYLRITPLKGLLIQLYNLRKSYYTQDIKEIDEIICNLIQ